MSDRTYVRLPRHAWHGFVTWTRVPGVAVTVCGRRVGSARYGETADRIPANGHLCGNCARVIAAATDIEDTGDMGNTLDG